MLKWEKIGDLYVAHVSDECAYTVEHDMDTTHGGWRSTFTTASEWRLHDTLKEAKTACEADYARRVAEIAAANGYVRLEPGQCVVQAEDLTRIVTWFRGDARTVPHTDMDTTLNRFAAAIDAAKGEWK